MSATVQSAPIVEANHVHDINVLERAEIVASDVTCVSEVEEPPAPNVSTTGKAQVVAEMVEFAFDTLEGSDCNPGARIMVANLLQFLSKQYEEDKALAVAEIEKMKEEVSLEKMKLVSTLEEEQRKLAMKNLEESASEPEGVSVPNEELKKGLENPRHDLEHENQELRTVIAAMGKDMDALKNKNETLQNEFLSKSKTIAELKKTIHEKSEQCAITQEVVHTCMQHVKLLKLTIESRDRIIDMQNKEIMVFRELVGKGVSDYGLPPKSNPVIIADDLIQNKEQPMTGAQKKKKTKAVDCASSSIPVSIDATGISKFDSAQKHLVLAIMSLGKVLDGKLKALFTLPRGDPKASQEKQWQLCISHLIPHGYRIDNSPSSKHVWNHWISAIMFYDFEDTSFGLQEAGTPEPLNKLDVLTNVPKPGAYENCSRFQAFVLRKYQSLFPEWFWLQPLLKILDGEVYSKFMAVAERVWTLHQVGQCCDPPPSVFRPVPLGTRYDSQYHEPLSRLSAEMEKEPHLVMLTVMPGFRAGDTVIKSHVVVKKM